MLSCRRTQSTAVFALAPMFVFFLNTPVSAETYQWTDKNGSVGFADSLEKVPPEYRKSAKRLQDKSGKNFQTVPGAPESNSVAPPKYSPPAPDPDYWQERILAAQEQLEQLKALRQQAQQAYDNLLLQQFRGNRLEPDSETKASSRIHALDQQIRDKEREISNMTEEARRAGIPSSTLSP